MKKSSIFINSLFCLILLLVFFIISLSFGAEKLNFLSFLSSGMSNSAKIILFKIRLPRSLLVLLTGILLGGCGAVFQLFFRNPLAEPGIMGISSGATLAAVIASVFGLGAIQFISPVNVAAFFGALLSGLFVTLVAVSRNKHESSVTLLLCGTALGTFYSALSSIILLTCNKELHSIYTWILGSFNGRGWNEFYFILIPSALCIALIFLITPALDLLSGGEDTALSLGIEVDKLKILVLISGALGVSSAVCAGGTISFVGLIAPHIVRKIYSPKAKILIPFSMIFGAILLLIADTLARTVIKPSELPAGTITALLGVPFFISIFLNSKK